MNVTEARGQTPLEQVYISKEVNCTLHLCGELKGMENMLKEGK